jgi:hypothetical protein
LKGIYSTVLTYPSGSEALAIKSKSWTNRPIMPPS